MTEDTSDLPVYDLITTLRDCINDLGSKLDDNIVPAIDVLTQVVLRQELTNTYIEINGYSAYLSEEQKYAVLEMLRDAVF